MRRSDSSTASVDAAQRVIVLYSRTGCHLCDVALELLRNRQARYGYRLVIIDVDSDPELVAKFDACVPVVAIDGKVRFRGRVEPALLDRQLRGDTANLD